MAEQKFITDLVKFTTSFKTYTQAGAILREETTLGYHFVNTGGVIVYINNFPLYPSGILDTMYSNYMDVSKYTIRFDTSVTPIPNPELTVIMFNKEN